MFCFNYLMGPLSYMTSVVDRNVGVRRLTVCLTSSVITVIKEPFQQDFLTPLLRKYNSQMLQWDTTEVTEWHKCFRRACSSQECARGRTLQRAKQRETQWLHCAGETRLSYRWELDQLLAIVWSRPVHTATGTTCCKSRNLQAIPAYR